MEDPEAQVPEAAGECGDMALCVGVGGEGLQRTLKPKLLPVIGVEWLAERKKLYAMFSFTNWNHKLGLLLRKKKNQQQKL